MSGGEGKRGGNSGFACFRPAFSSGPFCESITPCTFLHQREYLNKGDIVVVDCSRRCNVRLLGDGDFASYRRGGRHSYYGGHYDQLPARIAVPHSGYWNITLDLGGGTATIGHSINILKAA